MDGETCISISLAHSEQFEKHDDMRPIGRRAGETLYPLTLVSVVLDIQVRNPASKGAILCEQLSGITFSSVGDICWCFTETRSA